MRIAGTNYCSCPRCKEVAVTGLRVDDEDFNFDFCPNCMYLVSEGVELDHDSSMERVLTIKDICSCFGVQKVSQLRSLCREVGKKSLIAPLFTPTTKTISSNYTKLGGLFIFHNDPQCLANYNHRYPSCRTANKRAMAKLQQHLKISKDNHCHNILAKSLMIDSKSETLPF